MSAKKSDSEWKPNLKTELDRARFRDAYTSASAATSSPSGTSEAWRSSIMRVPGEAFHVLPVTGFSKSWSGA